MELSFQQLTSRSAPLVTTAGPGSRGFGTTLPVLAAVLVLKWQQ